MTESNTPRSLPRDWLDYRDHVVFGVTFRGTDAECRAIVRAVVTTAIYAEIVTARAQIECGSMVFDLARIEPEFYSLVCDTIDAVVAKREATTMGEPQIEATGGTPAMPPTTHGETPCSPAISDARLDGTDGDALLRDWLDHKHNPLGDPIEAVVAELVRRALHTKANQ